jgi:uncharacterized protein with FMN-binding domain
MTDRNFIRKLCGLGLVVLILAGYQTTIVVYQKDAEIAQLEAELTAYREAVKLVNAKQEATADNQSGWKDGIYTGSADGFGGSIVVNLEIADGRISSVEVVEAKGEDAAYLESAMQVAKDIVETQSTDVDAVSGATFSSSGIRAAAQAALEQAEAK